MITRRNLSTGLVVLVLGLLTGAASASAHTVADGQAEPTGNCVIHMLPSFMDQGFGSHASSVADIIEVECEPIFAEQTIKVSSRELYDRCNDKLSWSAISNGADPYNTVEGPSIGNVKLDDDGNATIAVWGGPSCAAGESLVSAHLEEAPGETVTTSFTVLPPKPTTPGVSALPASQVEVGDYSNSATIVQVEFPPAYSEQKVVISDEQLYSHCEGHLYWIGADNQPLGAGEAATVKLDDDGNAFVVLLGGPSCAPGETEVEASLEKAPYTTYTTTFTVQPPQPTWEEPAFTIEKLQEIQGSGKGFTKEELTGKLRQTVDYEMVVKNTGNVVLTFSDFTDAHCDPGTIAGGPGSGPVEPGGTTTYTCDHMLNTYGAYTNEATVTGTSPGGTPVSHTSNQVRVNVPEPKFTIEKVQEIRGSGLGFTKDKLTGALNETVNYEIVVTNTGQVPLTFSNFEDAKCDPGTIAGGPGSSPVAPGESTTYACSHVLLQTGIYTNVATVTGTPEGEPSFEHKSNQVEVEVPSPSHNKPEFVIKKLQRIGGSGSFTESPLMGSIGQTVEYEIILENTGNVPLTFSNFEDAKCDPGTIAGGPGSSPVAPDESTTYTCSHVLTSTGTYTNVATVTGTPEGEPSLPPHTSNTVEVEVPASPGKKSAFTVAKLQRIDGSGSFTKEKLTGAIGETVEYEIVVTNTGEVPLTFSSFEDSKCDPGTISGGPGANPVGVGESTTYRCSHKLTGEGEYENVATVTGGGSGEEPRSEKSNTVVVMVPGKGTPENKTPGSSTSPSTPSTTPGTSTPKHEVKAECAVSQPKLTLQGASGPKYKTFTVQVSASGIKQITFYLDHHKLKTLKQSQAKHGKFTIAISTSKLSYGSHKVSVKAVTSNANCAPIARSSQFVHTASPVKKPKFTG